MASPLNPDRVYASQTSGWFGHVILRSDDGGATWETVGNDFTYDGVPGKHQWYDGSLRPWEFTRVWHLEPSLHDAETVYAGVEDAALFKSTDGGRSFELVRSLWDHPHRPQWEAGFGGQAVHTVLPHPRDPARLLVAMSTGGVYRSEDAGASWAPGNTGIRAYFMPDEWPEFGQCVHKVARDGVNPERLYAQNHHGVYRSDDDGRTWSSIADGLPSDFGFPIVAHPHRPGVIYTFPLVADSRRFPVDERCRVYRSADAGVSWQPLTVGLPEHPYYPAVLRDALTVDDAPVAGVYFGTRSGDVYASRDEGDTWRAVATGLPDVLCVRAAVV
jgi:photosystem II stability/assembly factor-like uncharacterized protein